MMIQLQDSPLVLLSGKKRRERRAPIKAAKKTKRLAKITGKTSVINARYSKKANVQKAKENTRVGKQKVKLKKKVQKLEPRKKAIPDNIETPEDGSMPMPGGGGFPSGGGGGGGNYAGEPEEEEVYDEEIPEDEEQGEEVEEVYEEEETDPYGEMQDQYSLSAGIWDTAFTAIKGAAKGAVNEFKGKAKSGVSTAVSKVSQSSALQKENQALKMELEKVKDSQPLKMGGSALAGTVAGFIIGKLLK